MKSLILIRHAKSSWEQPGHRDFDRPLNERGLRDALAMGARLAAWTDGEGAIDRVLCSAACRAQETWRELSRAWDAPPPLSVSEDLYHASPREIISVIQTSCRDETCVAVIGHNPGMTSLLAALTNFRDAMPTMAVGMVALSIDRWDDLSLESTGRLENYWYPKDGLGPLSN